LALQAGVKAYSRPAPEQGEQAGGHRAAARSSLCADKIGDVEEGESGSLEPQADADDRALQHSVEAALVHAAALRIIDLQHPVADHALAVQAVELEIMHITADRLSADLAAGAEAADVSL
jgi:hypothetical protein